MRTVKKAQKTVSLPVWVCENIEGFFDDNKERLSYNNITSVTGLITRWLLQRLGQETGEIPRSIYEASAPSRFEHFNVYEDHATLFDNKTKRIVNVYFRNKEPYCEHCEKFDCEHIRFALTLPQVVNPLRERGWVIEDGKFIKGPS